MKILITGMTKIQCGGQRRHDFKTATEFFYQVFSSLKGVKVDWRAVEYNEDVSGYDIVIIGLGHVGEYSCVYLYNILSIVKRCKRIILFVDDWKVESIINGLLTRDLGRDFIVNNNMKAVGGGIGFKCVYSGVNNLIHKQSSLLAPMFNWGYHQKLVEFTPITELITLDPSPYFIKQLLKHDGYLDFSKNNQWICAALNNYDKQLKRLQRSWPIIHFNKKNFVSEEQLFEMYCMSAGMVVPKYKASGTGWWRMRFNHAEVAKNVIYTEDIPLQDDTDGTFRVSIKFIEGYEKKALKKYIDLQMDFLQSYQITWQQTLRKGRDILETTI